MLLTPLDRHKMSENNDLGNFFAKSSKLRDDGSELSIITVAERVIFEKFKIHLPPIKLVASCLVCF